MTLELILILIFFVLVFIGFSILLRTVKDELNTLRTSLDTTKDTVNASLVSSTKDISDRLLRASEVIAELKKETGAFSEIGRSMKDVQDYLRSPKLRGNIGEMVLKDLISQIFPKASYTLQHRFKSGDIVDAVIKTDAGLLPIDSKFPMENYQKLVSANEFERDSYLKLFTRDIKAHVKAISSKYILPEEKTLDFALMYIPAESVYYEMSTNEDLMDYARSLRVYPVSPNTLYAALQTILLSFEGKKIEQKAREVFTLLRAIQKDYGRALDTFSTLGTHLTNAYNKYGEVNNAFQNLGQKLESSRTLSAPEDKLLP